MSHGNQGMAFLRLAFFGFAATLALLVAFSVIAPKRGLHVASCWLLCFSS